MRLHTSWLVAFVLALPAPALGQAIQPADLIGPWVHVNELRGTLDSAKGRFGVYYLKVNPDGTIAYEHNYQKNDGQWSAREEGGRGSWSLTGDTLKIKTGVTLSYSHKIVLKDRRLVLWNWGPWDANRRDEKCAESVYERYDASKPVTVTVPRRITIQPADLVGTWAGTFLSKVYGPITDTLVIGADYTITVMHIGWSDDVNVTGTWALLPGDVLKGPNGNYYTGTIYLQNDELVRCGDNVSILKRVAP